jgi:hypothetical protein
MPKHEKPFHLDMPFDEALRRYAQTDPRELAPPQEKAKKQKKRRRSLVRPARPNAQPES